MRTSQETEERSPNHIQRGKRQWRRRKQGKKRRDKTQRWTRNGWTQQGGGAHPDAHTATRKTGARIAGK